MSGDAQRTNGAAPASHATAAPASHATAAPASHATAAPASHATAARPRGEPRSYHGQPVIKEPVWTWEIPCYFFTGGLGGASAAFAYLCELGGDDQLARRAWGTALVGLSVSPALLTSDLGKPLRFVNMLRMFKVTSPMSVGSWLLSASGASTALATANAFTGLLPRCARIAKPSAALLGLPLCTYTAALIANTAVPVWHEARRELPFVFAAGAALSAGAAAMALGPPGRTGAGRRLALTAGAAEIAGLEMMRSRLGEHAGPYEEPVPKRYSRVSQAAVAAGGALAAARGGRSRAAATIGGAIMCVGALAARWSIFKAGFACAADPRYVVGPQRRRINRGQRAGAARRLPG